jgi:hypothetical protein
MLAAVGSFVAACGDQDRASSPAGTTDASTEASVSSPATRPSTSPELATPLGSTRSTRPSATTRGSTRKTRSIRKDGNPTLAELKKGISWKGTFTMTLEAWDYCRSTSGQLKLTRARTYTRTESFSFSTAAPTDNDDGANESNPFYVSAGTNPGKTGSVNMTLFSAGLLGFKDQPQRKPYFHQYWDFDYANGRLIGKLVDDGRELGGAFNVFYDNESFVPCQPQHGTLTKPYLMREGTTLEADLGHDKMTMVVEGRSFDEARRFRIEARATRA